MAKKKESNVIDTLKALINSVRKNRRKTGLTMIIITIMTVVFWAGSLSSEICDLVFFSNLSKSFYEFFGVEAVRIPAGAILALMSIIFALCKAVFQMLKNLGIEIQKQLRNHGDTWSANLNKPIRRFGFVHKFMIGVSLITGLSLSYISVGEGVKRLETTINNLTADATTLIDLNKSVSSGVQENRDATKDNLDGAKKAQREALAEFEDAWKIVEDCRRELNNLDLEAEDYKAQSEAIRRRYASRVSLDGITWSNIGYAQKSTIKNQVLASNKEFEITDNTGAIQEGIEYDKKQIEEAILAIIDKEYRTPDGELILLVNEEGELVNVQLAISRLQNAISEWQADTGDVGSSSKVFTLLSAYIKADVKAGGMGTSQIMIMVLIFIFTILQEVCIAFVTPDPLVDEATLALYRKYFEKLDTGDFLLDVYDDYLHSGAMSQEDHDIASAKAVRLMETNKRTMVAKYSKNPEVLAKYGITPETKEKLDKKNDDLIKLTKQIEALEADKLASDEAFRSKAIALDEATKLYKALLEEHHNLQGQHHTLQGRYDEVTQVLEKEMAEKAAQKKEEPKPEVPELITDAIAEAEKEAVQSRPQPRGYSEKVDELVSDIEGMLKDDDGRGSNQ